MKIEVVASTKPGFKLPIEDAKRLSAHMGAVCYEQSGDFNVVMDEPEEKNLRRQNLTLDLGHQSVYEHPTYNFLMTGIPKMLAMFLNNESPYATSEKSARYTKMNNLEPKEKILFDKWFDLLKLKIKETYPDFDDKKIAKLSQENARYMISVFTPTTMAHKLDLRQLNYIIHWFNDFINSENDTSFNSRIKKSMREFIKQTKDLCEPRLSPRQKIRKLSLISEKQRPEIFECVYSTNYSGSFAYLAQAQRHRTIDYKIQPIPDLPTDFFIPPIIEADENLKKMWIEDISSVATNFPQGTMLQINERGKYEDFLSKSAERLCTNAQLEIMRQTKETMTKFFEQTTDEDIRKELENYQRGPHCTFPDFQCPEIKTCFFGPKCGLTRLI